MERKIVPVKHINRVVGWEHPKEHEIFCKKDHKLKSVRLEECEKCPYFRGAGQMDAIICEWNDYPSDGGYATQVIPRSDAQDELMRVSWMIDRGVLKKG